MRKRGILVALTASLGAILGTGLPASASTVSSAGQTALIQRMVRAASGLDPTGIAASGGQQSGRATRELGELNLAGGLNADVWAHKNIAYVGTWSGPCPGTGVKIIDAANPGQPQLIATAAGYPNTSAEDMQVLSVHTADFTGDLLGVGLQDCGLPNQPPGLTGLDLWDVTDPAHPSHLGFYDVGPSGGVHELSLTKRTIAGQERVFALAAVPFAEVFSTAFTSTPRGDFQLIDVTDPHNPTLADDWGAGKDGDLPFGATFFGDFGLPPPFDCTPPSGQEPTCRGGFAAAFAHSATPSADGETAYVAYWDDGAIVLDISNPNDITMVGRTPYPADSEGDTHSAVPNETSSLLVTTDEDFSPTDRKAVGEPKSPGDTWGFARIWSLADPAHPTHLSDFATPHSLTNKTDGFYAVHNPEVRGTSLYLSWYSDGLRIVDISNPAAPQEVAFFREQPTLDPTGFFSPNFGAGGHPIPFDWGVHVVGDRIYLSDINFGLYIVTRTK
jgi:hypothetical protein